MAETLTPLETISQETVGDFLRAIKLFNEKGDTGTLKIQTPCLLRNEDCPEIDLLDSSDILLFDIDIVNPLCGDCMKAWRDQAKIILNITAGEDFNRVRGPESDTNKKMRSVLVHDNKGRSLSIEHNKGNVVSEYRQK